MAGVLSSIVFSFLLMGFSMVASGCQSLLASYMNLNVPIAWIDIALMALVVIVVISSPILWLPTVGLVALFLAGI